VVLSCFGEVGDVGLAAVVWRVEGSEDFDGLGLSEGPLLISWWCSVVEWDRSRVALRVVVVEGCLVVVDASSSNFPGSLYGLCVRCWPPASTQT
jgi:hypothetical protein